MNCHVWNSAAEWAGTIKHTSMADLFLSMIEDPPWATKKSEASKIELIEGKKTTTNTSEKKLFVRRQPLNEYTKEITQKLTYGQQNIKQDLKCITEKQIEPYELITLKIHILNVNPEHLFLWLMALKL